MSNDTKVQMAFDYRSKKSYNSKFSAPAPSLDNELSAAELMRQKAKEEKQRQEKLARERKNGKRRSLKPISKLVFSC